MIRIRHKGSIIECESAKEAIELLKHIDAEDRKTMPRIPTIIQSMAEQLALTSPWSKAVFWQFIESLGEPQISVLSLLVKKKATAEELRKRLKLDGNQALAGVLSGISKQAGGLNISARSVYTVEDERKDGELTKTYAAAADFRQIAVEMNWPEE
jgi:hypothetical protein